LQVIGFGIQEGNFSKATTTPKSCQDLKTAPMSLKISECPTCQTTLPRSMIPLPSNGAALGEFRGRSSTLFFQMQHLTGILAASIPETSLEKAVICPDTNAMLTGE
jgi:hypothetical protein